MQIDNRFCYSWTHSNGPAINGISSITKLIHVPCKLFSTVFFICFNRIPLKTNEIYWSFEIDKDGFDCTFFFFISSSESHSACDFEIEHHKNSYEELISFDAFCFSGYLYFVNRALSWKPDTVFKFIECKRFRKKRWPQLTVVSSNFLLELNLRVWSKTLHYSS